MTFNGGAIDVGYFFRGAWPPEVRRAHESGLLAIYLDALDCLWVARSLRTAPGITGWVVKRCSAPGTR